MKRLILITLVSVLLSFEAHAVVAYNQAPGSGGGLIASSWLDPNGSDADMYAYDSFMVASNVPITEVRWRGGYIYGAPYGHITGFTITFFESIAGGSQPHVTNPQLPETFLAKYAVAGNGGETNAGTFGGTQMYDYAFALPTPFQAVAGTKYWLRIEATQPGYPDWGLAVGTGGDGQHFGFSTGAARFFLGSGDTAFTLLAPAGPYFMIATSALPGGTGATSGAGVFTKGASATVVATANTGFAFVNWTEDGRQVATTASYNFSATRNRTLTANFAPAFAITTSASPASGGTTAGDGSYTYGSSVTVLATPSANYAFVNWTENGVPVSVADHYAFTASGTRTLAANFVPVNPNSIPIVSQPHDGSGAVIKSAWYYPGGQGMDGDQYTFDGFTLGTNQAITEIRWRGGYTNYKSGAGKSPVADFTISFYSAIVAGSQPDILAGALVSYSVGGNAGETLAGTFGGTAMYDYDFVLPTSFNAVAGTKYWVQIEASQSVTPFYFWPPDWGLAAGTNGDNQIFEEIIGGTLAGGNQYVTRSGDTAFTLLGPAPGFSIVAIASPTNGGSVSGGGVFSTGSSVTVTAAPAAGYIFLNWNEHGSPVSISNQYTFTANAHRTLVANFAQQFTVATSSSPGNGGTTSGGGTFLGGADAAVVAGPAAGFAFVNWTEGGFEASTEATYYFMADANRNLVANFAPTFTIAASVSPTNGGFTAGGGVYASAASVTLVPTPNAGYAFVNWTENGVPVCTSPSYTFIVGTNRTLVANLSSACAIATSSASTNGSTSGDGVYPSGATVAVVAVPRTGHAFVNWTENGTPVSALAGYSFTASSNRTLVANFTANVTSVTFDFDTGTPTLALSQSLSFDQSSGGISAHFSSPAGPAFSIQTDAGTGYRLAKFFGKYLSPNLPGSALEMEFTQPVSSVALTFATLDFQPIVTPSTIQLTAHQNSSATPALGTATAQGTYDASDSMPMGVLMFSAAQPFNLVRIEVPAGLTGFLVDNVTVTLVPQLRVALTTTNTAVLSWPAPAPGFALRQNSTLGATNWVDTTNAVNLVGTNNQVIISPLTENSFYRLARP